MEMIAVMSGCLELQMMKEKLNVYVRMFNVHILNCHNDYHTIIYNDEQNKSVPPDLLTLTLALSEDVRHRGRLINDGSAERSAIYHSTYFS